MGVSTSINPIPWKYSRMAKRDLVAQYERRHHLGGGADRGSGSGGAVPPRRTARGGREALPGRRDPGIGTLRGSAYTGPNADMPTGEIEVHREEVELLTRRDATFVVEDRVNASEELRLRYRYLDLRRPRDDGDARTARTKITFAIRNTSRDGVISRSRPPS